MSPAASPFLRIIQAGLFAASAATVISGIYVYFLWGFDVDTPVDTSTTYPAALLPVVLKRLSLQACSDLRVELLGARRFTF
jgi:hypothetical protein